MQMQSWLQRIVQKHQRNDLKRAQGIPGEHPGNAVFPGQAELFEPDKKRRRKDVNKKKQPRHRENPSRSPREV